MKEYISHSSLDDDKLLTLYMEKSDQKAFNELLERHKNKVYSYLLSMVGNREVANDLFQDTFTKVISKLDRLYEEQGKFVAWVMRIAHNSAIDYLRRRKRVVEIGNSGSEDDSTDYFERIEDDARSSHEDLELKEATTKLMAYVEELPEEQKEVLMLRHYYEMPFKEIADLTGVSINTALGRMRYALINLRKSFEKENGKHYKFA